MAQNRKQPSEVSIKGKERSLSHENNNNNNNNCIHATTTIIVPANRQRPLPLPATSKAVRESDNKRLVDGVSPTNTSSSIQFPQHGEHDTMDAILRQPQSQSQQLQLEDASWKAENASLEEEFSALKTILGSYMDLQTRIFHDLGGEDDDDNNNIHGNEKTASDSRRSSSSISTASAVSKNCRRADFGGAGVGGTATDAAEAEAVAATVEHYQRGLVLSDAVRYIHYLETLRDDLASEKSMLEKKMGGFEELALEGQGPPAGRAQG